MTESARYRAFVAVLLCGLMITGILVMMPGKVETAPLDGWVAGTITDGANPIENAFVLAMPLMGMGQIAGSGWSDASGDYNLTLIGGSMYIVMVFHGGFWAANATVAVVTEETTVQDFTLNALSVPEDVTLVGLVKDELGNPVTVGNVVGFVNDPSTMGEGPPIYGNITAPDGSGFYSVNVTASSIGGGAGAMVPGYPMADNSTTDPFVSGMTYWINLTLEPRSYSDDAMINGTVTDSSTGLPLGGVIVNIESWNQWNSRYNNMTYTDSNGYYEMNVTNGTANVWFSKLGYSSYQYNSVSVPEGSVVQLNAVLIPTVATIRGNVTAYGTGAPIANAQVIETDGYGNYSITITNGSGAYELDAFEGSMLGLLAQAGGYGRNMTVLNVTAGDTIYHDFVLRANDAWLAGTVTDSFTGLPIPDAGIYIYSPGFSENEKTDMNGEYNYTSLPSGHYNVEIDVMDYRHLSTEIDVLPGGNIVDFELTPWSLPRTCKLYGFVNDSETMMGINNAQVETGLGAPDYSEYSTTWTDSSGYYEIWIPPMELQFVASADGYTHAQGWIIATGLTEVRQDVLLNPDGFGPNVTYDQSPLENVSWTNPTDYNIVVQDIDPEQFALGQFRFLGVQAGWYQYYMISMAAYSFNPLQQTSNDISFTQLGDNYTITHSWDATISGGWLWNGSGQTYFGAWQLWQGPSMYYGLRGYYTNSSMFGVWVEGTMIFDGGTGVFLFFQFDMGGGRAFPDDPTGMVQVQVSMAEMDPIGSGWRYLGSTPMGMWNVIGLNFTFDPVVPSGVYASLFAATDFGGRGWADFKLLTVDNDVPTADAGSDQTIIQHAAATLDGSGSWDNVGIVSWTWTFMDNGVPVEVYGEVASYNFTEVGTHLVTLTVMDAAGHWSNDTVLVDVTPDQPPIANAGPDQVVNGGAIITFDGTNSSDDVEIVNWTWSFDYDGGTVYLYGPSPTFIFLIEGVYDVTLVVTDSGGNTDTDTMQMTVSGMIPEFPTLLLPVIGIAGLVLFVRLRKKR